MKENFWGIFSGEHFLRILSYSLRILCHSLGIIPQKMENSLHSLSFPILWEMTFSPLIQVRAGNNSLSFSGEFSREFSENSQGTFPCAENWFPENSPGNVLSCPFSTETLKEWGIFPENSLENSQGIFTILNNFFLPCNNSCITSYSSILCIFTISKISRPQVGLKKPDSFQKFTNRFVLLLWKFCGWATTNLISRFWLLLVES